MFCRLDFELKTVGNVPEGQDNRELPNITRYAKTPKELNKHKLLPALMNSCSTRYLCMITVAIPAGGRGRQMCRCTKDINR